MPTVVPKAALTALLLAAIAAASTGCAADHPLNPSFPLRASDARAELRQIRADPAPPVRPVVVIGGMFDVGIIAADLGRRIRAHLEPGAPVVVVNLFATGTLDDARDRVVAAVEAAWPSDDPQWTTEVDVIGFSLGGIVARHAASPPSPPTPAASLAHGDQPSPPRLRIARLFTIASPNTGAKLAGVPTIDPRVIALRDGSPLLASLAESDAAIGYEVYPYVRLGDAIVGPEYAGLNGEPAYWVENLPLDLSHGNAYRDPRILADITRRLRGEPAYTVAPPAPIPEHPHSTGNYPEPVLTDP